MNYFDAAFEIFLKIRKIPRKYAMVSIAENSWRSYDWKRIKKHWDNYKIYVKKYEQKLKLKCMDQDLSEKDQKYLELLESNLNLNSILDARSYCNERIKVIWATNFLQLTFE